MELAPQKSDPVVGTGLIGGLVEQAVVAGGQGVVHVHLHAALGQNSELIEIAEAVEESGGPTVATASGLRRLGIPHGLAGLKAIAKGAIEFLGLLGAGQPLSRQSGLGSGSYLRTKGGAPA